MTSIAEREWRQTIRRTIINTVYDPYLPYLLCIPYLPLSIRKDLLKVARTQSSVADNPFLRNSLPSCTKPEHNNHNRVAIDRNKYTSHRVVVTTLSQACHKNPAFSALLSNLARSAPIFLTNEEAIEANKVESWEKEIQASISEDRPQRLDYRIWFDDDDDVRKENSASYYTDPQFLLNCDIHRRLVAWRDNLKDTLILPQTSSYRHLSRKTAYLYACMKEGHNVGTDYEIDVSTRVIERFYMETGKMVMGPTELRQAWKFNDLTPRTYFALGGKTYHGSKYIRNIANSLCNAFPATNFRSRYSINQVKSHPTLTVFTYDYSSFTSNLTELKYFLEALGEFCSGTEIFIMDSYLGVIRADLGDLILSYLQETTLRPEFSIHRYLGHALEPLVHMKAGMLGVYGNISLSTSLHGLYGCQICGDLECSCVGDDFFGSKELKDMEEFVLSVEELGSINRLKTKFWKPSDPLLDDVDAERWPFLKRPVFRYGSIMIHEMAIQLPIYGEVSGVKDPYRPHDEPITKVLSRLASQIRTMIRNIRVAMLDPDHLELLYHYGRMLYKQHDLPFEGNPPFIDIHLKKYDVVMSNWFLPSLEGIRSGDEWEGLRYGFEPRALRVEECTEEAFDPMDYIGLITRKEIVSQQRGVFSYLKNIGVVSMSPRYIDKYFSSLESYVEYEELIFLRRSFPLYDITIVGFTPWWLNQLCTWLVCTSE